MWQSDQDMYKVQWGWEQPTGRNLLGLPLDEMKPAEEQPLRTWV